MEGVDVKESLDWGALDEFRKMLPKSSGSGRGAAAGSSIKTPQSSSRRKSSSKGGTRELLGSGARHSASSRSVSSSRRQSFGESPITAHEQSPFGSSVGGRARNSLESPLGSSVDSLQFSEEEDEDSLQGSPSPPAKAKQQRSRSSGSSSSKQKRLSRGSGIYTASSMFDDSGIDGGAADEGESQMTRWESQAKSPGRKSFGGRAHSKLRGSNSASKVRRVGSGGFVPLYTLFCSLICSLAIHRTFFPASFFTHLFTHLTRTQSLLQRSAVNMSISEDEVVSSPEADDSLNLAHKRVRTSR